MTTNARPTLVLGATGKTGRRVAQRLTAVDAVGSFAELAVATGVTRLVLLAGRGEPEAEQAEDAVRASGADLTIVRSTWFARNFSEGRQPRDFADYARDAAASGVWNQQPHMAARHGNPSPGREEA